MNATRIETTIEVDGELHLTSLPVRKGDRIEAVLRSLDEDASESQFKPGLAEAAANQREAARREFLELARSSTFRSTAVYPTRDELHERS
jgi:hypothetical protein